MKTPISLSGLFNPRVLFGFAFCATGILLVMLSLSPNAASGSASPATKTYATANATASSTPVLTSSNSTSTTEVSDFRRFNLNSGGISALSYVVTHNITAPMEPGQAFPRIRIDRSAFPAEFAGLYADGGWQASWLTPIGQT